MPRIVLHAAVSLDGYIATPGGGLDWLPQPEDGEDYGFGAFLERVGALRMGRLTYDLVRSFGAWPYGERPTFVLSRRPPDDEAPPAVRFTQADPARVATEAEEAAQAADVWIVGGGVTARAFLEAGLVTHVHLAVVPVLLGDGIPQFSRTALRLEAAEPHADGVVNLHYAVESARLGAEAG